jgi:lysophospholipase L1-like esterase
MEVADASLGTTDGWLFLGDSITAAYSGHFTDTDPGGVTRGSFTELINQKTSNIYRPISMNAAMACTKSTDALAWVDGILNDFQGKYVTLNFGTNDSWAGAGDPASYKSTMQQLINKVTAKGMTPVISTIPWPNNGGAWQAQVEAFNVKISELYNENPSVIAGPDLYTLTKGKTNIYNGVGDVHFNGMGGALARNAWADAVVKNVYGF